MIKNNYKSLKKNNSGSALVVCIIVLLFVSILATVILYMSGINYRMKRTDLNTKRAFYNAEMPLETMQSDLVVPLSYALNRAYMSTNSRYIPLASADARRSYFYDEFEKELMDVLVTQYGGASVGTDGSSETTSTLIKNLVHNLTYSSETDFGNGIDTSHIYCGEGNIATLAATGKFPDNYTDIPEVYIVLPDVITSGTNEDVYKSFIELSVESTPGVLKNANECRILFKNIGVVTCQNGYRSYITTDIAMQFPPLDWEGGMGTSTFGPPDRDTSWDVYQLLYYINWQKS